MPRTPSHSLHPSRTLKSIKSLIRIPDERQTHLRAHIIALSRRLCPELRTHIRLRDFIDGEILRVDVASELGLEGRPDSA